MNEDHPVAHDIVWTPEKIDRFWDYESQWPENYFTRQVGHNIVRYLRAELRAGKRVLDYGCGTGNLIPHLLKRGCRVAATDLSETTVAGVRKMYGTVAGFEGAYTIPQLLSIGRQFDVILVVEVLEHLDDQALLETTDHLRRLAVAGGVVIVTVPNNEPLEAQMVHCPECGVVFHRYQHMRSWDALTLPAFLKECGFSIRRCWSVDFKASWKDGRLRFAKRMLQNLVDRRSPMPNLVCIAAK